MLQAVVVLAFAGLGIQRIAEVVSELLSSIGPARIGGTGLAGSRVVLWIVALIFGYVSVSLLGYDPLKATGIAASADLIWNILYMAAITDAVDGLWRGRIIRQ